MSDPSGNWRLTASGEERMAHLTEAEAAGDLEMWETDEECWSCGEVLPKYRWLKAWPGDDSPDERSFCACGYVTAEYRVEENRVRVWRSRERGCP